jgi:hypothetical protein
MPTPTYIALATVTLGASAASVTFGSIPATYRDLIIVATATATQSTFGRMRFNGDSGTNYFFVRMSGNGSSATSTFGSSLGAAYLGEIAKSNTGAILQMNVSVMDYSATDKHKTLLARADAAATGTDATASRWASTAAITSLLIFPDDGSWTSGSTFSLYGVIA